MTEKQSVYAENANGWSMQREYPLIKGRDTSQCPYCNNETETIGDYANKLYVCHRCRIYWKREQIWKWFIVGRIDKRYCEGCGKELDEE
jgi:hypothetical protein